jgi:hypothetical protein
VTRARAALLLLLFAAPLEFAFLGRQIASAAPSGLPAVDRVLLVVEDRVSFEELLSVPAFRQLASAGGISLMTTYVRETNPTENLAEGGPGRMNYLTVEWGTTDVPVGGGRPPLSRELNRAGIEVCSFFPPGSVGQRGGPTSLLAVPADGGPIKECPHGAAAAAGRRMVVVDDGETLAADGRVGPLALHDVLSREGDLLHRVLAESGRGLVGVVVVTPSPSLQMDQVGDEVTPLIVAVGTAKQLSTAGGPLRTLSSDTTRQTGLVANVDVAPTILDFFGIPIPSEMDGQSIRVTNESAPFKLHRLHLEQRRIRLPIQLAEVALVSAAGAIAIAALLVQARLRGLSARVATALRFLALCGVALPIPLMLGGLLPRLTYWVVVPFVVLSVVALAALARASRWPGPTGPFVFLGLVGLAVIVVDALLGWRGARIPLIGGTMFDGARFYGLPNAFLGLVLASALFVAAALPAFTGFLLLVAAGLFAGFPSLGADIGGAMTLFFAAGLWWVLRTRPRIGIRELAFVAGLTALGLGVVLLANRYLPGTPTHATAFVERTGRGLGSVLREFGARLRIGFGQLGKAPAAWIPLVGLPAVLAVVLRRPGPIGMGLAVAGERWKHALIVLTLSGIVAFFANDTGLAAAAPVFLYAMSGMAYPAWFVASGSAVNGAAWPSGDRHE